MCRFLFLCLSLIIFINSNLLSFAAVSDVEYALSPLEKLQLQKQVFTAEEKFVLYQSLRQEPAQYTLLNLLPLGLGSYVQQDYWGGLAVTLLDGLALSGLLMAMQLGSLNAIWYLILSITAFTTARVFGGIRAWHFAHEHNRALRQTLKMPSLEQDSLSRPLIFKYSMRF